MDAERPSGSELEDRPESLGDFLQRMRGKYGLNDIEVCTGACGDIVREVSKSAGQGAAGAVFRKLSDSEVRLLRSYQDAFAGEWAANADILDFTGFYRDVSRFIGDRPRQLGVDLGTGSGEMLGYMPCDTVFGVDINIRLLEAARDRLGDMGSGKPDAFLTPVLMEEDAGFPQVGAINLVMDDAGDPEVLRCYLDEMQMYPDLVTIVLPGAFGPYDDPGAHGRIVVAAASLLGPGGELVVAGRFSRVNSDTVDYFNRHMGEDMQVADFRELDYRVVKRYQSYLSENGISFTMFQPSLQREPVQNNVLFRMVKG